MTSVIFRTQLKQFLIFLALNNLPNLVLEDPGNEVVVCLHLGLGSLCTAAHLYGGYVGTGSVFETILGDKFLSSFLCNLVITNKEIIASPETVP